MLSLSWKFISLYKTHQNFSEFIFTKDKPHLGLWTVVERDRQSSAGWRSALLAQAPVSTLSTHTPSGCVSLEYLLT